ncbi:MAG: hypothetical protein R2724_19780 [Bryobacterales bacterium]
MSAKGYVYQPQVRDVSFASALAQMRELHPDRRIATGYIPFNTREVCAEVLASARSLGVESRRFDASSTELSDYLRRAGLRDTVSAILRRHAEGEDV